MTQTNKHYEAPQAELIEIESQSVLCASGGTSTTTGASGTTNMTMNNALVW